VANFPSENGYVSADGGVAIFNPYLIATMCPRKVTQRNLLGCVRYLRRGKTLVNHPPNSSNRGYVRKLRHRIRRNIPTSNFFKFPPHPPVKSSNLRQHLVDRLSAPLSNA
jgi:hypothetical protein